MKKQNLMNLMTIVLIAIVSLVFTSCGDDDDTNGGKGSKVKSQLVGVWKTTMSKDGWGLIELDSNGTLLLSLYQKEGTVFYNNNTRFKGHWVYNDQDNTVSMYTQNMGSYTFKVNMSDDGNSWAGISAVDGGEITISFTRISLKNAEKGLILFNNVYINNGIIKGAKFVSLGAVQGIESISTIPTTGWTDQVPVVAGNGYVVYSYDSFYRLYVNEVKEDATDADIKLELFKGVDESISINKTTLLFNSQGGNETLIFNNNNLVLFSVTSDQSWCHVEKHSTHEQSFLYNAINISVDPSNTLSKTTAIITMKTEYGKEIIINVIREGLEEQQYYTPKNLYLVGNFCGWDWAKSLKMVQCYDGANVFWHMVYIDDSGIKFNIEQAWDGGEVGFAGLHSVRGDLADEIIESGGNIASSNPGWYLMIVTCNVEGRDILYDVQFNKPEVWLMGTVTPTQSWSEQEDGCMFTVPSTADGEFVSPAFANDAAADSGVRAYVKVPGFNWWKTEFMVFDGAIVYRGMGGELDRVAGAAGQKLYLNFNKETGEIK